MSWAGPGRAQLLLDFETVYDTDPSTPAAYKMPVESYGLKVDQPPLEVTTIGNANPSQPAYGQKDLNGPLVVPVDLDAIGHWLKLLLGAPNTTGSAAPYTHVFKKGNTIPSGVIDVGYPDASCYYKNNGCKINTFSVNVGGNNPLTLSMNILGGTQTKGTSALDAAPTDYSLTYTRLNNCDVSAMYEGGSSSTIIEQFNLTIDNQLDSAWGLAGGGVRTNILRPKFKVTGNIIATFEGDALLLKGRNHTESALYTTLTSGSYSLKLDVPELRFSQNAPPVEGPRGLRQDLTFWGYYANDASASAFIATLINTQAAAVYA